MFVAWIRQPFANAFQILKVVDHRLFKSDGHVFNSTCSSLRRVLNPFLRKHPLNCVLCFVKYRAGPTNAEKFGFSQRQQQIPFQHTR